MEATDTAVNWKKTRTLVVIAIVLIVVTSSLTYVAFNQRWSKGANSREHISIKSVSLRASSAPSFYPTLFANLSVSFALSSLAASVNGVQVYSQPLNQENISNFYQGFGVQVKNVSVVLGKAYTATFRAIFQDGTLNGVSATLIATPPPKSYIAFDSWELCSKDCVYPSPFFEALVGMNASVPLANLRLFVNGTNQGSQNFSGLCCLASELWKSGIDNRTMPIVVGRTYSIQFVATFQDNSTYEVSEIVNAS